MDDGVDMIYAANMSEMVAICVELCAFDITFEANRVNGQWEITLT